MSGPWYRVPSWLCTVEPGTIAAKGDAWADLLRRWHLGERPHLRDLMRRWSWSGDRVERLALETWAWAKENGAAHPADGPFAARRTKSDKSRTRTGQEPNNDRTQDDTDNADNQGAAGQSSDNDRTAIGQEPDAPRARDPYGDQTRSEDLSQRETTDPKEPTHDRLPGSPTPDRPPAADPLVPQSLDGAPHGVRAPDPAGTVLMPGVPKVEPAPRDPALPDAGAGSGNRGGGVVIVRHGEPDRVAPKPVPVPDLEIDPRVRHVIERIPAAAVLVREHILTWSAFRSLNGADLHNAGIKGASKVALIDYANLKSHHNEPARPEPQWAVDMMAAPKVVLSDCAICKGARTVALDIRDDRGARTGAEVACACADPAAIDRKLAAYPRAVRYRVGDGGFIKINPSPQQVTA